MLFKANEEDRDAVLAILKIGEVTDIDPAKCKIRATFDDEDGKTSYWLPVLQRKTLHDKDFWLPDVGEDVLCLFFNEAEEAGFAVGSFYAGDVDVPGQSVDIRTVKFKDGSEFSYNRNSHELKGVIGSTNFTLNRQNIAISAPETISKSSKKVEVEGSNQVAIKGGTSVDITTPTLNLNIGGTTMTLNNSSATISSQTVNFAGTLNIKGNCSVEGNFSVTGNITANGTVHGTNI